MVNANINLDSMAIGEKVVTDHEAVRIVTTRISQAEMEVEQFRTSDGILLMKARFTIEANNPTLIYFDRDFWIVTLDGQPFDPPLPMSGLAYIDARHTDRALALTSK